VKHSRGKFYSHRGLSAATNSRSELYLIEQECCARRRVEGAWRGVEGRGGRKDVGNLGAGIGHAGGSIVRVRRLNFARTLRRWDADVVGGAELHAAHKDVMFRSVGASATRETTGPLRNVPTCHCRHEPRAALAPVEAACRAFAEFATQATAPRAKTLLAPPEVAWRANGDGMAARERRRDRKANADGIAGDATRITTGEHPFKAFLCPRSRSRKLGAAGRDFGANVDTSATVLRGVR
jgi:hypothetical protein